MAEEVKVVEERVAAKAEVEMEAVVTVAVGWVEVEREAAVTAAVATVAAGRVVGGRAGAKAEGEMEVVAQVVEMEEEVTAVVRGG